MSRDIMEGGVGWISFKDKLCFKLAAVSLRAAAFGFLFNDKCGFSAERLVLSKRRDSVESQAGVAFLLASERVQTGSYIGLDYIIGDMGITQGR